MKTKITSVNIDFNKPEHAHKKILAALVDDGSSVILVQEARDTVLRDVLPEGWATNQITATPAKRGSAVCWDRSVWKRASRRRLILGVSAPPGVRLMDRWISIQRLEHRATGKIVKFVSFHFPLRNLKPLPQIMAEVLIRILNRRGLVVAGGDLNNLIPQDAYDIAKRTGLERRGIRIDGFYISPRLDPGNFIREPMVVDTGHYPVSVRIDV